MEMRKPELGRRYTYSDYCTWGDDERWELIDGVPYNMSPAPTNAHQSISMSLSREFGVYLKGKACKVFHAPFDVRLNFDKGDDTVVQPDLSVICDPKKLENGKGCKGAPDLVIEILSPSTTKRDKMIKFNKYLDAGVREYWIVDGEVGLIEVYTLKDGAYQTAVFGDDGVISVGIFDDLEISLVDIFAV